MTVAKIKDPNIAVVIVGNGWTHARAQGSTAHFPSVVGLQQTAFDSIDMENTEKSNLLDYQGALYVWGKTVYTNSRIPSSAMGNNKVGSITYKRLLLAALYELYGARDVTIDALVTTFPVLDYQNKRDEMRLAIAGTYGLTDGNGRTFTYHIEPNAVKILPEGLPTIYDALYNERLNVQAESILYTDEGMNAASGVVNIGTFTTDMIFIENQAPNPAKCTSIDIGMRDIWQAVQRHAKTEHGKNLSLNEADTATKNGFYYAGNTRVDIHNVVKQAAQQVSAAIANQINTEWDNGAGVYNLLFAGGGAPQLNGTLADNYEDLTNVYSYEEIESAASTEMNGAYKFARIKLKA